MQKAQDACSAKPAIPAKPGAPPVLGLLGFVPRAALPWPGCSMPANTTQQYMYWHCDISAVGLAWQGWSALPMLSWAWCPNPSTLNPRP